jgi:hypothetical protein
MSRAGLRLLLALPVLFAAPIVRPCYAADDPCDRIYRLRAESLDDLLHRAHDARPRGALPAAAYAPTVDWLFLQGQQLYHEARAHYFEDITEATYWQRSRLKFPNSIDQEHDALHRQQ